MKVNEIYDILDRDGKRLKFKDVVEIIGNIEITESLDGDPYPYVISRDTKNETSFEINVNPTHSVICLFVHEYFDNKKITQILFWLKGEMDFSLVTEYTSREAMGIFSTIVKITKEYLVKSDAVFFSAKISNNADAKELEKRTRLYQRIALKVAKELHWPLAKYTYEGDHILVLSKVKTNREMFDAFISHMKSRI